MELVRGCWVVLIKHVTQLSTKTLFKIFHYFSSNNFTLFSFEISSTFLFWYVLLFSRQNISLVSLLKYFTRNSTKYFKPPAKFLFSRVTSYIRNCVKTFVLWPHSLLLHNYFFAESHLFIGKILPELEVVVAFLWCFGTSGKRKLILLERF